MLEPGHVYDQDSLRTPHNHDFMSEPAFQAAYARGIQAAGTDFNWHWRVHVGLWAASQASRLEGDFVECGVGKGFLSSAVMQYLEWDRLGRMFYLLDTFSGIDEKYITPEEFTDGAVTKNQNMIDIGVYATSPDPVIRNFSSWKNVRIVVGSVPETLPQVAARRIAYLHLDMNCISPEIEALNAFWDRIVSGAPILLDDYAYNGHGLQKRAIDEFARSKSVDVLSIPTGQGLILKPPPTASRWQGLWRNARQRATRT